MKNSAAASALLSLTLFGGVWGQVGKIEDLKWLSGCWESKDTRNNVFSSEQWMKPAGGLILGIGRTVKKDKPTDFEFMRIEQKGGDIFFFAKPRENKIETPFKLIVSRPLEAIFENQEHDFPQRVIYRRYSTKLIGRIEGRHEGKFIGIDFPMIRTRCE